MFVKVALEAISKVNVLEISTITIIIFLSYTLQMKILRKKIAGQRS